MIKVKLGSSMGLPPKYVVQFSRDVFFSLRIENRWDFLWLSWLFDIWLILNLCLKHEMKVHWSKNALRKATHRNLNGPRFSLTEKLCFLVFRTKFLAVTIFGRSQFLTWHRKHGEIHGTNGYQKPYLSKHRVRYNRKKPFDYNIHEELKSFCSVYHGTVFV